MIIRNIYEGMDIIVGNKKRIDSIKRSIKEGTSILRLETLLETNNIMEIKTYLQNNIFFEIIEEDFVHIIIKTYNSTDSKNDLLDELRESYNLKGVKGILFSWGRVLSKYS